MPGQGLSLFSTIGWAVSEFWLSLLISLSLLVFRLFRPVAPSPCWRPSLDSKRRRYLTTLAASATAVPVLVWALEANAFSRVVLATHASVSPRLLLTSMQVFLGGLLCLAVILAFDLLGRALQARRISEPALSTFPASVLLLIGLVVIDWLLSEVGWWALLSQSF